VLYHCANTLGLDRCLWHGLKKDNGKREKYNWDFFFNLATSFNFSAQLSFSSMETKYGTLEINKRYLIKIECIDIYVLSLLVICLVVV
jgi:hypothetical protein